MSKIKEMFFKYPKERNLIMVLGIFQQATFLSLLVKVGLGTDPFTFMNIKISENLHIGFGTWQLFLNLLMLILVIIKAPKLIGPGTVVNMIGIGYIVQFWMGIWDKIIPERMFIEWPYRGILFFVALMGTVIGAAVYMNADVGQAPYDALPRIIHDTLKKKWKNIPFAPVRMVFDFSFIFLGLLVGGKPGIGHVLMALFVGPMVTMVGKLMHFSNTPRNNKKDRLAKAVG